MCTHIYIYDYIERDTHIYIYIIVYIYIYICRRHAGRGPRDRRRALPLGRHRGPLTYTIIYYTILYCTIQSTTMIYYDNYTIHYSTMI